VLPEYFLTGFPLGESMDDWRERACLAMDDSLYVQIGAFADKHDLHIAGNAYESDPHFPSLYFQSNFIIAPKRGLILRYRRVQSMFAPSPHDVLSRYLEIYGESQLFPVVDTELGRLGMIASEEILYPEIARMLAFKGAELFLHCTSEAASPADTGKSICRRARAVENMAIVVSANSAGIFGAGYPIPGQSTDAMSCIIDSSGRVLAEAGHGESMIAHASIELSALRAQRRRVAMGNVLGRQRPELFARAYAEHRAHTPDQLLEGARERSWFRSSQQAVIERLSAQGKL
jgi:predicted amidohydrolase